MIILTLLLSLSVLLFVVALIGRRRAGFGYGKTISHDDVRLSSERYMLRGQPDRIVQRGRYFIPEEKKSGRQINESYQAQLGVYLVLVEEEYGVRPPYGFIILRDGERVKVKNTRRFALTGHWHCGPHSSASPATRRTPLPTCYASQVQKL